MSRNLLLMAIAVCGLTLALAGCNGSQRDGRPDERSDERQDETRDHVDDLPLLTAGSGHGLPSVSGLAHHAGALYLAVHDTKSDDAGPRLAVVRIDVAADPVYRELELDWRSHGGPSHDLESIAAIPGRRGEYLAAESNNRGADRRRILHLEVSGGRLPEVEARIVGAFELPADVENIEGMAIATRDGRQALLGLCERDERKGDHERRRKANRYAFIRWAEMDIERHALTTGFVTRLRATSWPEGKGLRTCSDLYLDHGAAQLWLAATLDDDGQPHGSMIYRMPFDDAMLRGDTERRMTPLARVPGHKLEAIAAPILPGWGPTLGSDDDGDLASGLIWPVKPGSWK